jgi:hypothetical protein
MAKFMAAEGDHADIARKVILGYISYLPQPRAPRSRRNSRRCRPHHDLRVQLAPASGLADLIGVQKTIDALKRYDLAVPALLDAAARGDVPTPLFNLPFVTPGRYLAG